MYSYKLSYIIIKNHHLYCLVLNEQLITLFFHCVSYMLPCMFMCKAFSLKLFHVPLGFLSVRKDFISFFIKIAVRIRDTFMYIYKHELMLLKRQQMGRVLQLTVLQEQQKKNLALAGWCCSKQWYRKYPSIDCDLPIERTCLWLK